MKAILMALGALGLLAQQPAVRSGSHGALSSQGKPVDGKEKHPVLLGEVKPQAILASRAVFRENLSKQRLSAALKARWKAIRHPLTLVAVFGSWCGDSHRQLPGLLALDANPNPFIEVHYLGVARDRALAGSVWPRGCPPPPLTRVPTFYLFAIQPGGGQKLVGSVVETPPRAGQSMAEALVELVEAAAGTMAHSP